MLVETFIWEQMTHDTPLKLCTLAGNIDGTDMSTLPKVKEGKDGGSTVGAINFLYPGTLLLAFGQSRAENNKGFQQGERGCDVSLGSKHSGGVKQSTAQ